MMAYTAKPEKARVASLDKEKGIVIVELDKTLFYPGGGGQPHDTGRIFSESFEGEVVEAYKDGKRVLLKVRPLKGELAQGEEVVQEINQERRRKLSRMHTGEHLLFQCILRTLKEASVEKVSLGTEESSLFLSTPKKLSWRELVKAEELANKKIQEGLNVAEHVVPRDKVKELFPEARTRLDRVKSEKIRVVEIGGFDYSACGGTHVSNTREIGSILITGYNSVGSGRYEVRFRVDALKELFSMAGALRMIEDALETERPRLVERAERLASEEKRLRNEVRRLQSLLQPEPEVIPSEKADVLFCSFENFEKKQLIEQANRLKKDRAVVCAMNKREEKGCEAIILAGEKTGIDAGELFKCLAKKLGGRGGGREGFAMGMLDTGDEEKIKKAIAGCLSDE